jgi:NADH-quinone oxidoreductase subunit I
MDYFLDSMRSMYATIRNLFRPPTTVEFPKVIRPRAERLRASFALLHEENGDEACIGCLQCEKICPSQVISIVGPAKKDSPITGKKRSYADDFTLDLAACIFCELCVQVCPTDAIVMTREQEVPAYAREDLVLTMAKLYANEKSKHRAWSDATKLNEMQVPPKPPKPAAPAAAQPPLGQSAPVTGAAAASGASASFATATATVSPAPPAAAASAPGPASAASGSTAPSPHPSGGEGGSSS